MKALVESHPNGASCREDFGEEVVAFTESTFRTYLGTLKRCGLVVERGSGFFASDILVKGA